MNLSGIKSIITYSQSTQPGGGALGETWLNLATNELSYWNGTEWKRVFAPFGPGANSGYSLTTQNPNTSFINRMSFSSDSVSLSIGSLTTQRKSSNAANSSTYAYIMTGQNVSSQYISSVDKLSFINDSYSILADVNVNARQSGAGYNSSVAGYSTAGINANPVTINKITFANDGFSTPNNIPLTAYYCGSYNSSLAGYITGGFNNPNTVTLSSIQRLVFATEASSSSVINYDVQRFGASGFNSSLYGFSVAGVVNEAWTTHSSVVNRLTFSADNGTTIRTQTMGNSKTACHSFNSSLAGYITGGQYLNQATYYSTIERLSFSSDTANGLVCGALSIVGSYGCGIDGVDFVSQFI